MKLIIKNLSVYLLIALVTCVLAYISARVIFLNSIPEISEDEIEYIYSQININEVIENAKKSVPELDVKVGEASLVYKIKRGDNLLAVLLDLGFKQSQSSQINSLLGKYNIFLKEGMEVFIKYNPKYIYEPHPDAHDYVGLLPKEHISIKDFDIISISFKTKPEEIIIMSADNVGNFNFKKKKIDLEKRLKFKRYPIMESLFNDGLLNKVPPSILLQIIKMYSFDVDFQRDVKNGELFEILYEEYYDTEGRYVKNGDIIYCKLKNLPYYRYKPFGLNFYDYFNKSGHTVKKSLLKTPINGALITSKFGPRKHPVLGYSRMHSGIDFAAPRGTPILAGGAGIVVFKGWHGGHGNYIKIRHNSTYETAYAHISHFNKNIRVGSKVKQGEVIAYVGSTGLSTGPHLHYEVLQNGNYINPSKMKSMPYQSLVGKDAKEFKRVIKEVDLIIQKNLKHEAH